MIQGFLLSPLAYRPGRLKANQQDFIRDILKLEFLPDFLTAEKFEN
jgi:hypothetical protein